MLCIKMASVLDGYRQNYIKCMAFTAICNGHSCTLLQGYASLFKHIIVVAKLNTGDKVSLSVIMMKIDQILIKLNNLLLKNYPKYVTHSIYKLTPHCSF